MVGVGWRMLLQAEAADHDQEDHGVRGPLRYRARGEREGVERGAIVDDLVARLALDEKPFLLVARGTFAEKSAFFHLFSTVVLMMC